LLEIVVEHCVENGWKLLEIVGKLLETVKNCWKWLEIVVGNCVENC
jgi:hypothetical protein